MSGEMALRNMLIDEYEWLSRLRRSAVKENAKETVKEIDRKIMFIKMKLQPLEFPDDEA